MRRTSACSVFAEGTVDEITEHADVRRIYLGQA